MNCRPNDLAIVVDGLPKKNIGRIVRVLKLETYLGHPLWRVDGDKRLFDDDCLRPIRDEPGADETLTWCDVPSEVTA